MDFNNKQCLCGTVTVGERGQIVIPKKARDYFGFAPNTELIVIADKDIGITIISADSLTTLSKKIDIYDKKYGTQKEND